MTDRLIVCAATVALLAGMAVSAPASASGTGGLPVAAAAAKDTSRIARLDIEGAISERPGELDWLFPDPDKRTIRDLIDAFDSMAADNTVDGVLIRLKDARLGQTQIEEIGAAMKRARNAGKKIHVFAENYGPGELLLGSYADVMIGQDGAGVSLPGLHMEEMFLADTLKWAGMQADFVQVGDYKGASEALMNSEPSKAWDENISQLLDSIYGNMQTTLMQGRDLTADELNQIMERAWMTTTDEAAEMGLIDHAIDLPNIEAQLKEYYGADGIRWDGRFSKAKKSELDMSNPFAMFSLFTKQPDRKPKRDTIAVVHIDGAIVDGDSTPAGMFGEGSVGSRTIRKALEEIRDEDKIKGVVIRINSPGGSATASEVIWQGVRRVAEEKPVWVSVGSMAASGGYYIAVGGDKIYVNPSSIVGSIGVVGGKIAMDGLYDKLKINVVERSRGPRAGIFRSTSPWSEQERSLIRDKMSETYDLFTKRVTMGRDGIDLSKTAEGRLFTGDKALGLKMADAVGSVDTAIDDLAKDRGLTEFDVMDYPGPKSLEEVLQEAFGGFAAAKTGAAGPGVLADLAAGARVILGEETWAQLQPAMAGLMQMRKEPVILMSPRVLIFR